MKTEYEYIKFVELNVKAGTRKTSTWSVENKKSGAYIGFVKWYAPWRQYCFFSDPGIDAILSRSCLDDIKDFLYQLMRERVRKSS